MASKPVLFFPSPQMLQSIPCNWKSMRLISSFRLTSRHIIRCFLYGHQGFLPWRFHNAPERGVAPRELLERVLISGLLLKAGTLRIQNKIAPPTGFAPSTCWGGKGSRSRGPSCPRRRAVLALLMGEAFVHQPGEGRPGAGMGRPL